MTRQAQHRPRRFLLGLLWACCTSAFAIETAGEMPKPSRPSPGPDKTVEAALEAHPDWLGLHRGYNAYLGEHADIKAAEEAWIDLGAIPEFRPLDTAFDEALQQDVQAQALFDQFYDQIARDPNLRAEVEALQRTEFGLGQTRPSLRHPRPSPLTDSTTEPASPAERLSGALDYLRANPDQALRFFQNPRLLSPTPEALNPLLGYLDEAPELREELFDSFQGITGNPLAHSRLFPWWTALGAFDTRANGAYTRLAAHFMTRPHHFWIWHQRYCALAADAQARAWIRYWHRHVRRTPTLATAYYDYLREASKDPARAQRNESNWQRQFGAPAPWPPKEAPPNLSKLAAPPSPGNTIKKPTAPRPRTPSINRPSVPRPQMPSMPSMPTMPTRPVKPTPPPKPDKPTPNTAKP